MTRCGGKIAGLLQTIQHTTQCEFANCSRENIQNVAVNFKLYSLFRTWARRDSGFLYCVISDSSFAEKNERGAMICISQHPRRTVLLPIDPALYKSRHLIGNFVCKLKEFKRIAMRAEKN